MFNPLTGTVWQAKAALARLNAYEIGGKGLIKLGPRYGRSMRSAARLRGATSGSRWATPKVRPKAAQNAGVSNMASVDRARDHWEKFSTYLSRFAARASLPDVDLISQRSGTTRTSLGVQSKF